MVRRECLAEPGLHYSGINLEVLPVRRTFVVVPARIAPVSLDFHSLHGCQSLQWLGQGRLKSSPKLLKSRR